MMFEELGLPRTEADCADRSKFEIAFGGQVSFITLNKIKR
jgi:hypothetical protein